MGVRDKYIPVYEVIQLWVPERVLPRPPLPVFGFFPFVQLVDCLRHQLIVIEPAHGLHLFNDGQIAFEHSFPEQFADIKGCLILVCKFERHEFFGDGHNVVIVKSEKHEGYRY